MSEIVELPRKPAHGDACNGCGLCCIAEPCPIAAEMGAVIDRPCPYVEWEAGRFWCGLVRHPSKHLLGTPDRAFDAEIGPRVRAEIGDGECDSEGYDGRTAAEWLAFDREPA